MAALVLDLTQRLSITNASAATTFLLLTFVKTFPQWPIYPGWK